ncbi:MAG TPA: glycosyltransferase family 4 protein [Solirubrobacteraceae bacterium]|nr:glycosyltransferase family 4 protein [Solirubrobacteraceae bacterium]
MTPSTRVLMLGPVNHPHVEHLALAMHERGLEVIAAGDAEAALPPSVLPPAGIRVLDAPRAQRRTPAGAAAHVRWIRGLARDLRPDVVHAHWMCGYAALAAVAGASPLVVMAWGSDVLRAGGIRTLASRIALHGACVAMADSQALLERLVELGARHEATVLVNWGVDLDRFAPPNGGRPALRERLGLGPGPVVLSPRSLTAVYNPATVLAAFRRVAETVPGAQLVLKHMGAGAVAPFEANGRIRVVGHVPYERMAWYYQAADVCVSIPSSDSSPRSVWEAMACGCPVVISDLAWVRELIVPERDALVVPVDDGAVAAAIRRVLVDRERAANLSLNGRRLAETHRDRQAEMDRLADVYRRVAA